MNGVAALVLVTSAVLVGKADAKGLAAPPSVGEITRHAQSILENAKGQSLKRWYGAKSDVVIPTDAVASASALSCVRMPQYEDPKAPMQMWRCDYNLEIRTGGKLLFSDHEQDQLSQDTQSRSLEIPPPQVPLPK